jgi:D-sedoheptulose 7-phosphate isomerase
VSTAVADVREAFARRVGPGEALADDAERLAHACLDLARRFDRGGRLLVFGNGGAATDAHHIVVEFVHPVIIGKRALPAFALTNDAAAVTGIARTEGFDEIFAAQLRLLARPEDIALGLCADGRGANVQRGLATARDAGLLTVALIGGVDGAPDWADHVLMARTDDPGIAKEVFVTTYHILWELVHVLLESPGVLR